jgi:ribosomal protein S27E
MRKERDMAISKNWMEMTPKKELHIFRLKCHQCGDETEVFSDELYKLRKCYSCKEIIDITKCDLIQVH